MKSPRGFVVSAEVLTTALHPKDGEQTRAWLNQHDIGLLHISSLCWVDLMSTLHMYATGRKDLYKQAVSEFERMFAPRVLPYGLQEAKSHMRLEEKAREQGMTLTLLDGAMAAVAHINQMTVVAYQPEVYLSLGLKAIEPVVN